MTVAEWCLKPSNTTCCGICPNGGISGIESHISLAFSSLASIIAIALSPESAPSSLFANILQCDAYAISLLWYLLAAGTGTLDLFHAGYALMLALACLIPITAIATSPPWAVTGEESPETKAQRQEDELDRVLYRIYKGSKKGRKMKKRVKDEEEEDNALVLEGDTKVYVCGVTLSHLTLYVGFSLSVLLWAVCFYYGIYGAVSGTTVVVLAQANCTERWGGQTFMVYCNAILLGLAAILFIATIINPLVSDVASSVHRTSIMHCISNPKIVFGSSFAIWVLWMVMSFALYINAGNTVLLEASEFSWGFGSVFSAMMILIPITSIVQAMWGEE